jgi:glycosyltransferase involved in cell wall biosynthesis
VLSQRSADDIPRQSDQFQRLAKEERLVMDATPLISVVTPALNNHEFIRETIDSVLAQDYPRVELIVMDGGSTDGTLDILRSYGDRIDWHSEPDKGQSDALNKGFARTSGDLLTWLNADDLIYPGSFQHSVDRFGEHPDAGLVYGRLDLLRRDGTRWHDDRNVLQGNYEQLLHWDNFISQPGTLFTRAAWQGCGPLSVIDHYAMDWDLWVKIAAKYPIVYTPHTLAGLRIYSETKTASGGLERFLEITAMLERNGSRAPHLYYKIGRWHYDHNQMPEARRFLIESLRRGPSPLVRRRAVRLIVKSALGSQLITLGRAARRRFHRQPRTRA